MHQKNERMRRGVVLFKSILFSLISQGILFLYILFLLPHAQDSIYLAPVLVFFIGAAYFLIKGDQEHPWKYLLSVTLTASFVFLCLQAVIWGIVLKNYADDFYTQAYLLFCSLFMAITVLIPVLADLLINCVRRRREKGGVETH